MDFKSLFDSLDKATDILNIGRLIFYTAAGFCGVLPVSMCLWMLAQDQLEPYWRQFLFDMAACAGHYQVWLVALGFGFVSGSGALACTKLKHPPATTIDKESYEYQYPRLFSGGKSDGKE